MGKQTTDFRYNTGATKVPWPAVGENYNVDDAVKANVPVGYSEGETEVQVTMYSGGTLLNCFELTEENCLAWVVQE